VGKKGQPESWRPEPEEHDFAAATNYLSLLFPETVAAALAQGLRDAQTVSWEAKDLIRASRLPLLADNDRLVIKHLKKVARGELLAPVLLVRGDGASGLALIVADGYHRICASYHLDEEAEIPCRITDLSESADPAAGAPSLDPA
jgi:hypothetical protein